MLAAASPHMAPTDRKWWLDQVYAESMRENEPIREYALGALAPAMKHLSRAEEDVYRQHAATIRSP